MRISRLVCLIATTLTISFSPINIGAQSSIEEIIINNLDNIGLNNITVLLGKDDITLAYENKIFRDELDALEEILEISAPVTKDFGSLLVVPMNSLLPIGVLKIDLSKLRDFQSGLITRDVFVNSISFSLDVDKIRAELKFKNRKNKSELETDIIIFPQIKTRFGDWDNPVRAQLGIIPTLRTTLAKGLSIFAQVIIPFYDDLEPATTMIRPGIITINQTIRFRNELFLSTTLGQFANVNRYGIDYEHGYGIDLELKKYFADGIWSLGTNFAYTGNSSYRNRVWQMGTMDKLTYNIAAEVRIPRYNMSLYATAGQFLYGDKGVRIDVKRNFGETDIGFFAVVSGGEKNGGFNISIPIFPSKYYSSPVRLLPAKSLDYEYRVKAFPREGQRFDTGYKIEYTNKRLTSDYIKSFLFN